MNILVAGGAGFLGSNLVAELLAQGHRVYAVDNLITGREKNIAEFSINPNFVFIKADTTNNSWLSEAAFAEIKFDQIYHLASPASPPKYQQYPLETLRVNSLGTENLLKLAQKHGAKFLFASTSEIYGDPKIHPQPESYWGNVNSFGPRSCYDEAKRYGEAICYSYLKKYQLNIKIARIFNTYGPKMDPADGRVISNLVTQALRGQDLTVYGDGSQTRSYCFVDDLVAGLIKLMASEANTPVNLGNPEEYTILETAQIILQLVKAQNFEPLQSKIIYQDLPQDDPLQRCPDISLAKKLLAWQPQISLEAGLKKTIAYFEREIR